MRYFFSIVLAFCCFSLAAQEKKFEDYKFSELVDASGMIFQMPPGFFEVPVVKNETHPYQFAVRDSLTGFEARYFIKPYKIFFKDSLPSDPMTYSRFVSCVLTLSGNDVSNVPEVKEFNATDVKQDSGGDKGWYSIMRLNSKFAGDFSFCSVSVVQKSGVGEYYIFKLFNTIDQRTEWLLEAVVSSVRFK